MTATADVPPFPNPAPYSSRAARRRERARSLLLPKAGVAAGREPNRDQPRLAVYKRRSKIKEVSSSLARQEADCLGHIKSLGGIHDPIADTYADDDISAKGGKYRPGMETLLRAVQAGCYDGIVVYEVPRALRNRRESLIFRQILHEAACDIYVVRFPMLSLYGPTAFVFELLVDNAAAEVEATGDRVASWHRFMSRQGAARAPAPWGMTSRDSGIYVAGRSAPLRVYTPDEEPREELGGRSPADLVRQAVADVLAGTSQRAIVGAWNKAGYPSARGGVWTVSSLGGILTNPTIAGIAHFKGSIIGEDGAPIPPGSDGAPLRVGDALVDETTWNRLAATFATRVRQPRSVSEHLLSGVVRCGTCDSAMVFQKADDRRANASGTYRCQRNSVSGPGACATSNCINASRLETLVLAAVQQLLSAPDLLAAAQATNSPELAARADSCRNELMRINQRLQELEDLWLDTPVKDSAAKDRFHRRRQDLQGKMTSIQRDLAELTVKTERTNVERLGTEVAGQFQTLAVREQRSVLLELIDRIVIATSTGFGPKWKPERVSIQWATD